MTIDEVAEYLGLGTSRIRQLARAGELKGTKLTPRAWVFDRAVVEAFAAQDRQKWVNRRKDDNPPG